MVKKGDTLIEVVLAIGIFSMIAIAVVAVMSSGSSSAQTALETTLTRQEIDAQAETLRFIHTSYIAEKDSASEKYQSLWRAITSLAVTDPSEDFSTTYLEEFAPTSCQSLYTGSEEFRNHAFVIDYRKLGNFTPPTRDPSSPTVEIPAPIIQANNASKFRTASTYPRIIYSESGTLSSTTYGATASSAEGIFILAVKDDDTTNVMNKEGTIAKSSAFYDFYIRTCWYGINANDPSTISTVIRLYDPSVTE